MRLTCKVVLLSMVLSTFNQVTNCQVPSSVTNNLLEFVKSELSIQNIFETVISLIFQNYVGIPKNISDHCASDVERIFTELMNTTTWSNMTNNWAAQMFDSLPKPPSGIFNGNLFWLGNFWECIGIDSRNEEGYHPQSMLSKNASRTDTYFRGEYCLVSLNVNLPAELRLGLCFPDSCTFEDKTHLVAHWLRNTPAKGKLDKSFCQTKEKQEMDTTDKVITGFLMGIIFLVIIGTFVDCMNYTGRSQKVFAMLSMSKNLNKIFDLDKKDGEIQVLHGIRFITLSWIVLGYSYSHVQVSPLDNFSDVKRAVENDIWFGVILNAQFSVDTFFVIGSLLVSFIFLRKMQTSESCNFHLMYLSRYIRITPTLMTTVAILAGPFYYLLSGPVWPFVNQFKSSCRDSWWAHITYIFNLLPTMPNCNGTLWYLAVDMQMFLVTPLVLYPLYKKPKWGLAGIIISFAVTIIGQMLVVYYNNVEFIINAEFNSEKIDIANKYFYMTPWGHFAQYLVGIFLGYVLHVHFSKKAIYIRPVTTIIGWILSAIIIASVVFGTYPVSSGQLKATPIFNVLYGPLSRQAWTISVAWIIFACATGNGGQMIPCLTETAFIWDSKEMYLKNLV